MCSSAMPVEMCSEQSIHQLQHLIFPKGKPLLNLKSLYVSALSPKAFMSKPFEAGAVEVFRSLERVELIFRLEREDRYEIHTNGVITAYKDLNRGSLRSSLAAAKDLEYLKISFDDLGYFGPAIDVKAVLGDSVWPKLCFLDLDCMRASDDFVDMLQRQPSVKRLALSFMSLENTNWYTVLKKMRTTLSLIDFLVRGLLEDSTSVHNMVNIDKNAYVDAQVEISMADMLDDYVTQANMLRVDDDDDDDFNPLMDVEWADPDILYDLFGYPEDSDIDMCDLDDGTPSDTPSDEDEDEDEMDVD